MALIYSSAVNKRINLRSKRSCDNGKLSKSCPQTQTSEENGMRLGSAEDVFSSRRHSGENSVADDSGPSSPCICCANDTCKCASTSAKNSIGSCGNDHRTQKRSTSNGPSHQKTSLHRSKTTCRPKCLMVINYRCTDRNAKRKTTVAGTPFSHNVVAENSRKISQPLMTSSMYAESSSIASTSRNARHDIAMRKAIAKKHLNRKMALDGEEGTEADSPHTSQSPHRDHLARCLSLHQSFFNRRRSVSVDEGAARAALAAAGRGADSSPDSYDSINDRNKKGTLQRMKNRFAKWKLST